MRQFKKLQMLAIEEDIEITWTTIREIVFQIAETENTKRERRLV